MLCLDLGNRLHDCRVELRPVLALIVLLLALLCAPLRFRVIHRMRVAVSLAIAKDSEGGYTVPRTLPS